MAGRPWTPEEASVLADCVARSVNKADCIRRFQKECPDRSVPAIDHYLDRHQIENPDWKVGVPTVGPNAHGKKPLKTEDLIRMAEAQGLRVIRKRPGESVKLYKIEGRFEGDEFSVGIVSDSQLGSKYQQLTLLHEAYDLFAKRSIKHVLHAGDLLDGQKLYRGHEYETFYQGADAQRDYTIANYPKKGGITTFLIGGNHDYAHWRLAGMDVLSQIAERRPDIKFLGYFRGMVEIGGLKIRLGHPRGGMPYARSYRLQKHIEQLSPQEKPNVALLGHLHVGAYLPQYRNVEGFQLPCFQAQTPYLAEMGVHPTIGFLILTFTVNGVERKDGLVRTKHEWFHSFVPRERDY